MGIQFPTGKHQRSGFHSLEFAELNPLAHREVVFLSDWGSLLQGGGGEFSRAGPLLWMEVVVRR